jgi:uncharacterized protein with GYD domain
LAIVLPWAEVSVLDCQLAPRDGALRRLESPVTGPAPKGNAMPTYVQLVNFTEQGVKNVKDTIKRSEAFKALAKKHGCTVKEIFWVHGHYDAVSIIEAPDDTSATALSMSVAKLGNIRTQTLRAYSAAEMAKILEKVE